MPDVAAPVAPAAAPAPAVKPAAPTIQQAKAEAREAIRAKPPAPLAEAPGVAPQGKQPVASLTELAKLSASNRDLVAKLKALEEAPKDTALAEARELYKKDKRAGLAKFLSIEDASSELEQLTTLYFQAAPGTPEKVEAKNDLETKVAQLEAKQKEIDDNRKAEEEKTKQGELTARQQAARDATCKIIDSFVAEDGTTPLFPYSAKNREEASQHTIQAAVDIASARKLDLNSMPDEEVHALLKEANGLVEEELADIARERFTLGTPNASEPANIIAKAPAEKPAEARAASAPAKPVVGTNVARPAAATNTQKPHMSVLEAKQTLMKQLRSARRQ